MGGVDPGMKRSKKPEDKKGVVEKWQYTNSALPNAFFGKKERRRRGELINKSRSLSDGSRASIVR